MSNQPELVHSPPQPPSLRMIVTLTLVAMLSGLIVVSVYQATQAPIAANQRAAIEAAIFQVLPGAVARSEHSLSAQGLDAQGAGERIYAGYNAQGELIGWALEGAAMGYADVIRLLYGYDPKCACVVGMKILKSAETPGLGDKIFKDAAFLSNFEALDARLDASGQGLANRVAPVNHGKKHNPWEVDAISGATVSSKAVAKAIDQSAQRLLPLLIRQRDQWPTHFQESRHEH